MTSPVNPRCICTQNTSWLECYPHARLCHLALWWDLNSLSFIYLCEWNLQLVISGYLHLESRGPHLLVCLYYLWCSVLSVLISCALALAARVILRKWDTEPQWENKIKALIHRIHPISHLVKVKNPSDCVIHHWLSYWKPPILSYQGDITLHPLNNNVIVIAVLCW